MVYIKCFSRQSNLTKTAKTRVMTICTLSICIPTVNRKEALISQVKSLLNQASSGNISEKIEIVIGDNSDIVDQQLESNSILISHPSIKYFNNGGNIGYARNVNNVLMNAKGAFA